MGLISFLKGAGEKVFGKRKKLLKRIRLKQL